MTKNRGTPDDTDAEISQADRVAVANALLDSVAAVPILSPISEAFRLELDRRIDDDDANPDDVIPWEEVKAQARARRGK